MFACVRLCTHSKYEHNVDTTLPIFAHTHAIGLVKECPFGNTHKHRAGLYPCVLVRAPILFQALTIEISPSRPSKTIPATSVDRLPAAFTSFSAVCQSSDSRSPRRASLTRCRISIASGIRRSEPLNHTLSPLRLHGDSSTNSKNRIFRRILQSEILSHLTRKTNCDGGQCGSFVMFCAPNAKILTEVSSQFTPKNPVRRIRQSRARPPSCRGGRRKNAAWSWRDCTRVAECPGARCLLLPYSRTYHILHRAQLSHLCMCVCMCPFCQYLVRSQLLKRELCFAGHL